MNIDGFLKLLEDLELESDSKEAKVLIYLFKGHGLYFKKEHFNSGL